MEVRDLIITFRLLVGSLDEERQIQGHRKSHLALVVQGRGLVDKRYLVIVLPLDLLTNQLAESHICDNQISSQVHRFFLLRPKICGSSGPLGLTTGNFEAVQIGFWSI